MQNTDIPAKIAVPFANAAGGSYVRTVPVASQIGTTNGAASYTDGFPPLCFIQAGAGGYPPDGRDTNGVLHDITSWNKWSQAGGLVTYDSAFSTTVGGYPLGAFLQSTTLGHFWISTANNNTTDPDGGSPANWNSLSSYILASAALTGNPTAPTQAANDGSTKVANTFYADRAATNAAAAAVTGYLPLTGGTLTGVLSVGNGTTSATLNINGAAGTFRSVIFQTGGSARFLDRVNQTAESGSNVGSDRTCYAFEDDGVTNHRVYTITRSTQVMGLVQIPTFPTATAGDSSTNGATTAFVAGAISGSGYSKNSHIYAGSGTATFTIPAGVTAIFGQVVGGGGAGGGATSTINGGCGAAGGYAEGWITGLTPGGTITITVGAGGAGVSGAGGNNGGTSSIGAYMSATGGGGGAVTTSPAGGAGGVGSGGELNLFGGSGSDGGNAAGSSTAPVNGLGGASYFGGGSRAFNAASPFTNQSAPGGGGGAAYDSSTNVAGQNGHAGAVILRW